MILLLTLTLAFLLMPIVFHNAYPDLAAQFAAIDKPTTAQWIVFHLDFYRRVFTSPLFLFCFFFSLTAFLLWLAQFFKS
jgi:hypothetical protein